ncbi:MAG: Nitrogen regulatory protein, partial [Firmicutes bacterium]|nr:Nitrogen regulatory protein [Bacillota bacterium]
VPVEAVLEAAKKACSTGNIGDGKIFVYDVENAVEQTVEQTASQAIVPSTI